MQIGQDSNPGSGKRLLAVCGKTLDHSAIKTGQNLQKLLKPWHMGTHLRVLSKRYPMNTNMTGFGWCFKNLCVRVLLSKVALELEGLKQIPLNTERWALLLMTSILFSVFQDLLSKAKRVSSFSRINTWESKAIAVIACIQEPEVGFCNL